MRDLKLMGQGFVGDHPPLAQSSREIELRDPLLEKQHRLVWALWILLGLLVIGTAGFQIIGPHRPILDCVFLTMIILTTVGMKENAPPLSPGEQVWAIALMMVGIGTVLYATSVMVAFFVDGDLRRMLGSRQLQQKISHVKDHIIVCGFGRMGRVLCETLHAKGVPFVLIESNPQRTAVADQRGYLYILGDAMTEQALEQAGVLRAKGLALCLRHDADNVFTTLSARGLNPTMTIIARSERQESQAQLIRAGASRVICPPVLGANRAMHMLLQPEIDELLELAVAGPDLEVSKVSVSHIPAAVGQSLRDLALPARTGLIVVAVVHADGQRSFSPAPEFKLSQSDEVIVIGPVGGVDRMMELLVSAQNVSTG